MLEHAGYRVRVPRQSLCCGRPLYDYGMLDTAKALLREILDRSAPADSRRHSDRGPGAKLHDRIPRRADESAVRRRGRKAAQQQSFILSEFLQAEGEGLSAAQASRARRWCTAIAITSRELHFETEVDLLEESRASNARCRIRAAAEWPARSATKPITTRSGSDCGERVLLPAVRSAPDGRADRHRRLQLPRDDSAGDRPAGARTLRRSCRWRSEKAFPSIGSLPEVHDTPPTSSRVFP